MAPKTKRIRRTPEDARRLILDAAEASMGAEGPAGLRLTEVARKAGVSHPTILHHFGSREGLVRALNTRGIAMLKDQLLGTMNTGKGEDGIALSFAAYRGGLAQRMIWLLQAKDIAAPPNGLTMFDEIVRALHETRLRHARPGTKVDIEDSRAIVHLTAIAAFGDAVIGARLRRITGAAEKAAGRQFEQWLSRLIEAHIRGQTAR